MDFFKKFCKIYCEKNYILKKQVFFDQAYECKSFKSYYNFVIKQKLKEKTYENFENENKIPSNLKKIFTAKKQLENFDSNRITKFNKLYNQNLRLKTILEKLDSVFMLSTSHLNFFEKLEFFDSKDLLTVPDIYIERVQQVKRTRKEVLDHIKQKDIYSSIFYILMWGNHKELSITQALTYIEENRMIKELSNLLIDGNKPVGDIYNILKEVKGLGPAFFTKILYFYSHAFPEKWAERGYIMDQFTSKSINLLRNSHIKNEINLSHDKLKINKDGSLDQNTNYINYKNFNQDIQKLTIFFKKQGNLKINEELVEIMLFGSPYNSKDNLETLPHKRWRNYLDKNYILHL